VIVNFASGTHPFPAPWWNVDLNDHPGVNERVDLLDEFPPTLVDIHLAYVGHFLEHITPDEAVDFLTRVHDRMDPRGRIVVAGPDAPKAREMHVAGELTADLLIQIGAHGTRYGNDCSHVHEWECSVKEVQRMLEEAGFHGVGGIGWDQFPHLGIPVISDAGWQLALIAAASSG
jgi:predicted SAM-dependent methyltransferase